MKTTSDMPTYHLVSLRGVGSFLLWYQSSKQSHKRENARNMIQTTGDETVEIIRCPSENYM